ncbi:MAG: zinc ribbon domain-containing protein [Ferrimicrobium sp.]
MARLGARANPRRGCCERYLNESYSSQTCPGCLTRYRPSSRHYRCKNPVCGFSCHRDALGAINIAQ